MNFRVKRLIVKGDTVGLKRLLSYKPQLASARIHWGIPPCSAEPLHYLADGFFNGRWSHAREGELAEALIHAGAPVNGLPDSDESPLHGAASLGCLTVAKALVTNGANLEQTARYPGIPDGTPLDFAVHFGMVEVVDLLVRSGAEIISARMAAGAGLLDQLEELLPKPIDEQLESDALRCATICNRREIVDFFLDRNFDLNKEIDGATALHWAAWEAKAEMVEHLLTKGARTDRKDPKHNLTPLGWARHRMKERGSGGDHSRVIEILEGWDNRCRESVSEETMSS
mgnify:CR=1 FL=1